MPAEPQLLAPCCPRCGWQLDRQLPRPRLTSREIVERVADYTGFKPGDLTGHCRLRKIVLARWLAIWLVRELRPDLSISLIGRLFNRDHTTIIHALREYPRLVGKRDPAAVWLDVITNG